MLEKAKLSLTTSFLVKIEFLDVAKLEFDEAIAYYEKESEGLGLRFKNEIKSSVGMIIQFPKLYPFFIDDIRKCVAHTFPYSIFYVLNDDIIFIYAIANHFKDPQHLVHRFTRA